MRHLIAAAAFVASAAHAEIPGPPRSITDPKSLTSPANPEARVVPLSDLAVGRSVPEAVWSTDGTQVFLTTNLVGRTNIWRVPAKGGWPVQMTQSDDTQGALNPSPDGRTLAFAQDKGGDEFYDIYTVPTAGGPVARLTDTPEITESDPTYSPDGRTIAVTYKTKAAMSYDLALLDPATRAVRPLTREKDTAYNWSIVGWAPDGKSLIANRSNILRTSGSVWRVDIATGATTELIPDGGKAYTVASGLSPDGRTLAYGTTAGTGQLHGGILDLTTGKTRWLKPTPWEQYTGAFSPDGKSLLVRTNTDGRSTVTLIDVATLTERALPFPPGINDFASGRQSALAPDNRTMLLYVSGADTPADLFLATADGSATPLTRLSMASLTNLPKSQIVTYRSFDKTPVSAIVTMPFNLKRDGTNPAIVLPHGGPTGQAEDYYSSQITAFATRGYIVIQPNFRGSTGYGKAFQTANIRDLGGGDLKDVVAAKDFLVASGYVDAKKVGIFGGSYGGFMTLMALGRTPDVFAAGVQYFGIINWHTMEKTSDPVLQKYLHDLLGDPVKDKGVYDAASPLTYIKAIRAPLLSLQGENDIRVPRAQAQEVADLLKAQGSVAETVFYPAEGHGFAKRENRADALRRTIGWFDKYLKGIAEPDVR